MVNGAFNPTVTLIYQGKRRSNNFVQTEYEPNKVFI
jgi:hypothetical protein